MALRAQVRAFLGEGTLVRSPWSVWVGRVTCAGASLERGGWPDNAPQPLFAMTWPLVNQPDPNASPPAAPLSGRSGQGAQEGHVRHQQGGQEGGRRQREDGGEPDPGPVAAPAKQSKVPDTAGPSEQQAAHGRVEHDRTRRG